MDSGVSYLRILAMLCIVVCHLLEGYGNPWSATFYVGVPLFFVLSASLYGERRVKDWRQWGLRRLKRIYLPYVLTLLCFLLVYGFFFPSAFSWSQVLLYACCLQGFGAALPGLNHLWFVTAILVCYAVLPLMQCLRRWALWMWLLAWAAFVLSLLCFYGRFYWFPLYLVAYFSPVLPLRVQQVQRCVVVLCIALQVITWKSLLVFDVATGYVAMRSFLALALLSLRPLLGELPLPPFARWMDRLTYPLYLVHNPLMIGPLSFCSVTPFVGINVGAILMFSLLLAWAVSRLTRGWHSLPLCAITKNR